MYLWNKNTPESVAQDREIIHHYLLIFNSYARSKAKGVLNNQKIFNFERRKENFMLIGRIEDYCKSEMDNDGCFYLFIRADVQPFYRSESKYPEITALFDHYRHELDQQLYIKGNYIFFVANGQKYYYQLSVSSKEWEIINDVIQELSKIADNVAYKPGELD